MCLASSAEKNGVSGSRGRKRGTGRTWQEDFNARTKAEGKIFRERYVWLIYAQKWCSRRSWAKMFMSAPTCFILVHARRKYTSFFNSRCKADHRPKHLVLYTNKNAKLSVFEWKKPFSKIFISFGDVAVWNRPDGVKHPVLWSGRRSRDTAQMHITWFDPLVKKRKLSKFQFSRIKNF